MDTLARTAHRDDVEALTRDGALTPAARTAALRWIRTRLEWATWIDRLLLATGSGLVMAGVIYFFAFNWAAIPAFAKFAVIQTALAGTVVATVGAGIDGPVGRALMMGSAVLVGVLLAVFGQVYQTGADAWQLFGGWAALIAGWVAIGRMPALWMLFIALIDVTILQWIDTQGYPWWIREMVPSVTVGVVNAAFLAAAEWGAHDGVDWLRGRWARRMLWVSALLALTWPAASFVGSSGASLVRLAGFVAWLGSIGAGYVHYRHRAPDLTSLSFGSMSFGLVALSGVSYLLRYQMRGTDGILLLAIAAVAIAGALALWLKHVSDEEEGRDE